LFEREIALLWKKVSTYQRYADEIRELRIQAVEALRTHEEQLFGKVKDIESHEEPRTERWKKSQSGQSIKMLKVTTDRLTKQLEEHEEKIQWMEQTGEEVDRDHGRFIEEARLRRTANNENVRRFISECNQEGLAQLAEVQARLDHYVQRVSMNTIKKKHYELKL